MCCHIFAVKAKNRIFAKIFITPVLNLIVDIGNNSTKYYLFNGNQIVLHSRRENGSHGILGEWYKELIFVDSFVRHGYHRNAKIENENG